MTATSGYRCGNDERGIYCSGILDDDLVCPECGWDGKKFIADKIHPLAKKYIIRKFLKKQQEILSSDKLLKYEYEKYDTIFCWMADKIEELGGEKE